MSEKQNFYLILSSFLNKFFYDSLLYIKVFNHQIVENIIRVTEILSDKFLINDFTNENILYVNCRIFRYMYLLVEMIISVFFFGHRVSSV